MIENRRHRNEMAGRFKDNKGSLKISVVVDLWLTCIDVPSLSTMYIYKPMAGHNLNGLVLNHAYSVYGPLNEWTAEHIDAHFNVIVRA